MQWVARKALINRKPVEIHIQYIQLCVSTTKVVSAEFLIKLDVVWAEAKNGLIQGHCAADMARGMPRRPIMVLRCLLALLVRNVIEVLNVIYRFGNGNPPAGAG